MKPAKEVVENLLRLQAATGGTSADIMISAITHARREGAEDMRKRAVSEAETSKGYPTGLSLTIQNLPLIA